MFDALTTVAVAAELRATVLNGRVQRVVQSSPLSIGLEVYAEHRRYYLLASAHAQHARIHLSQEKPTRDPQALSPLLLLLRRRVRGALLQEITVPPLERVLAIRFYHPALPPEEQENTLVIEVMGRHSNLILLDGAGTILDSIKRVTAQMSPSRPVLPHRPYQPPPPQAKMDPHHVSAEGLARAVSGLDTPLWEALVHLYRGISPLLAREAVFRAGGDIATPSQRPGDLSRLAEAITSLWSLPTSGAWEPWLALQEQRSVAYAPYRITHRPDWQGRPCGSISQAVEAYFAALEPATGHQQLRRILQEAIGQRRARVDKRLAALQSELSKAGQADALRQKGEWLLAYQYQVQPGQTALLVDELEIALDPLRSPVENAQEYFAAYRKAVHAGRLVPERIAAARQEQAWLSEVTALLHSAETYDEIAALAAELEAAKVLTTRRATIRRQSALRPRTFRSVDGFTILVGRTARQNEEISLRHARGHDLWFHARGRPGAHVVVATEGRPVPTSTLREAAELAAYYSQGRREKRVAVDYTECRYVRRLNAAYPGLVHYSHEQTLTVTPARPVEE